MGGMQKFENRLEQMISGVFARAFRSAVQPVEITAALQREIDNKAQILSRDRKVVPNAFEVELSGTDLERLESLGPQLIGEFTTSVREYAQQQSYVFPGPVRIGFEEADDLSTGRFRVRSQSQAKVTTSAPVPPTPGAPGNRPVFFLDVNGAQHPVAPPGVVIGRGTDAGLRINDPGISRRHIEFRVGYYQPGSLTVHDLGSTNGMIVNGQRVREASLYDGSTVRIGTTTIRVVAREENVRP